MVILNEHQRVSRAEIGFKSFPCEPCAMEADKLLRSLEGTIQISFNPGVARLAVVFDAKILKIPAIISTLESFGLKPRIVSVVTPIECPAAPAALLQR